ncbi:TetR/AcrR family transcriptional regulator [Aeromicrobium sp. A1-2]|uniref:TetR/AcrR family transcriptional regulator n=1 Tax=Aeromicrobium sp. A1-2 TaxID=2107713 RepID=UPI001C1FF9B0|nr:TetR/AcrR family transcriptional regulator [Aeromicrobium sp. A1-2]
MARPRTPPELRRTPQQDRSRMMVERIIAAGQTVLLRDGYEKASTNRVAQEAGISPGSLYQYFPDKDSILNAVIDRYSDELSARLTKVLADRLDLPGPELVRATLEGLLEALAENVEFLRLVVEQLPRAQFGDKAAATEQRVSDLVSTYLVLQPSARVQDPAAAAWLLVRLVEHVTVQYVLERPAIAEHLFIDELTRIVTSYLGPTTRPR